MTKVTAENDASMEDVLASIRRIISDDIDPEAEASPSKKLGSLESEDVLDLTDVVTSNGAVIRLKPRQASGIHMKAEDKVQPKPASRRVQDALFSDETALKSLSALKDLDRLNDKVLETATAGSFGSQTMEEFIVSMMKPMLKAWMDAHLPSLVKWVVAEQIEKLLKERESVSG